MKLMNKQTKRLYFENPYQVEFDAKIIEKTTYEEKFALILDKTCFYPESGGQPSDKGTINGIKVIKVMEENSRILHVLEEDVFSEDIKGIIDWTVRFDYMQQHTGQHILSQSFDEIYNAETLSFHLGDEISSVEIDLRKITEEEVEKVERLANEIVFQDREIKTYFIQEEETQSIPLRKPPKKKGLIRIVEISDFDYSACGGTHLRRTGEVGIIKILKLERIRNNVRFEFLCGKRALQDYTRKNRDLRHLSNELSVSEGEILNSFEKLVLELKAQKKKNKNTQEKLIQYEAQEAIQGAKEKIIKEIYSGRNPEEVRSLALNIIKKGEYVVLYGLKAEKRVHLVLASSETLDIDMRELVPIVISMIKGKGGGSPSLVQIAGEDPENLELALDRAYEYINNRFIHA